MSAAPQTPAKAPAMTADKPPKPLTPAQTAKPFTGKKMSPTAAKKAVDTTASAAAKQGESAEVVAAIAKDDPAKAVEKIETKLKAINANNVARVANSHLTSNEEKLQPLVSLKTGKPLEKFPATSKDILDLKLLDVDAMLNALETDRSGNETVKKEKLRLQIGLKANPA